MKGNGISLKELRPDAVEWLTKLHQTLVIKEYGKGTVRNYCQEMKLLFKYFNHKAVVEIRQGDIEQYLQYIKEVHKVGRAKCRSVAQSCSFFFKRILPAPYILPSNLYPKKQFLLPNIMSEDEVIQLFAAPLTLKEYCVVGLLYGCGLRISEASNLRLQDIESHNKRLKVFQGKGAKDRYTLLPEKLLLQIRSLYLEENRPTEYLFTSKQTKRAVHVRSMQVIVNSAMAKAGFKDKPFTAHTLRHNFCAVLSNIYFKRTLFTPIEIVAFLDKNNDLQFSYGVKIRHAGYLHAKNKMERIAAVCKELKLPPPMQKAYTPVALRLLIQTGRDIMACPVCGQGRMNLVKTLINHHGILMDITQLRNRGSPKIKRTGCNR